MPEENNPVDHTPEGTPEEPKFFSDVGDLFDRHIVRIVPAAQKNLSLSRALLIAFFIVLFVGLAWVFYRAFKARQPLDPIYTKVESVKRIRELRLVKHHYESIIPITKTKGEDRQGNPKKEILQFLLVAPVQISGYVDLGRMKFDIRKDSLVEVRLPPPEMSKVYIDFKKTYEYTLDKKSLLFGKKLEKRQYKDAFEDIARAITRSKANVVKRAVANGILEETNQKAENYIRNLLNGLGYRVDFIPPEPGQPGDRSGDQEDIRAEIERLKETADSSRKSLYDRMLKQFLK